MEVSYVTEIQSCPGKVGGVGSLSALRYLPSLKSLPQLEPLHDTDMETETWRYREPKAIQGASGKAGLELSL